MIIFSDLHLCEKTADTCFNEVLPGLFEAAKTDKDKKLVCLGDFYHIRYKVDVVIQNRVFEYFSLLGDHGIDVWLLPGNHDQINEQGENALTPFNALLNVSVFDEICETSIGTFIPYRKNKEEIVEYLKNCPLSDKKPLFMHEDIIGFEYGNGIVSDKGIPFSFVNSLHKWIITGHYHKRQIKGHVHYVGSPYQIDAGEAGQEKGYVIYYPDETTLHWVDTDWGPKHYNFGEVQKGTTIYAKQGDVVRVKAPKGEDLESFRKSLNIPEGVSCVVEHTIEENSKRLGVVGNSLEEYAKAYVDEFKGNLSPDILMEVYRQLNE